ncbi:MAG: hypothetical protein PHV20_12275 [Bacteroidales bacterium]|nr:hypothetical protein [Bacteroidales bacterium]
MKTTIETPTSRVGTHSDESIRIESKSLSKSQIEYVAVFVAALGFIIMASTSEDSLFKPAIGCGLIIIAALVAIKNKKEGGAK